MMCHSSCWNTEHSPQLTVKVLYTVPQPSVPFWHNAVNQHLSFLNGCILKDFYLQGWRQGIAVKTVICVDIKRKGTMHCAIATAPIFSKNIVRQTSFLFWFLTLYNMMVHCYMVTTHPLSSAYPYQGRRWAEANPSCHRTKGRVDPGEVSSLSQG